MSREFAASAAPAPVPGNRLPKRLRLQSNGEFRQAYAQGEGAHGRCMVVFRREGEGMHFRLGVVASRKVGGSPERARAKRRLREVYRLNRHRFVQAQADIVVVARHGAVDAPWNRLVAEFLALARKAGVQEQAAASDEHGGQACPDAP